ncbi:hypothetical protein PC129_g1492 [Phytophthora cactorum]|uniref:Uncharacterized protein n=1 Tax=Phytophthora cactorum TaxID=29920 RepID=A0A329T3B3_9STRA|nr:hypothetical protein Pcac1_g11016 [Phytophthora cactorum]KAG2847791.1 hypothetical protein PC111_g711 [Phytophthora cactorum]KAG2849768.1 hypothetical protein PC112_g59 [Phytophthora cactorum]KAG2869292.1 hypothetical protein PC113_g310 [Phytophthora cactorum]KAG2936402.1 hypothetical protein PC114_g261 [Phytophthora cactorum]
MSRKRTKNKYPVELGVGEATRNPAPLFEMVEETVNSDVEEVSQNVQKLTVMEDRKTGERAFTRAQGTKADTGSFAEVQKYSIQSAEVFWYGQRE